MLIKQDGRVLFLHYNFGEEPLHNRERLKERGEFRVLGNVQRLLSVCFAVSKTNPELNVRAPYAADVHHFTIQAAGPL